MKRMISALTGLALMLTLSAVSFAKSDCCKKNEECCKKEASKCCKNHKKETK